MSAPMPVEERVKKATLARVVKARTRRFQKYVAEMRSQDLVVHVMVRGEGGYREHPDYTEAAVEAAVFR